MQGTAKALPGAAHGPKVRARQESGLSIPTLWVTAAWRSRKERGSQPGTPGSEGGSGALSGKSFNSSRKGVPGGTGLGSRTQGGWGPGPGRVLLQLQAPGRGRGPRAGPAWEPGLRPLHPPALGSHARPLGYAQAPPADSVALGSPAASPSLPALPPPPQPPLLDPPPCPQPPPRRPGLVVGRPIRRPRSVGARFRRAHRKPARRAAPAQCAPRAWFQRSSGPGRSWGRRGPSALGAQRRRAGARPAGCLRSGSPRWVSGAWGGAGGARRLGQCRGRGGRARSPEQPCPAVPGRRASCGGAGSPSSPRPRPPRFARADASGPWRLCPSPLILLPPPASVSARSPAASVCPSGDPPSVQPLFYLTSATLKKK